MKLHNLQPAEGSRKNVKRVGRGEGSGHGGQSTRGMNGAKSRSGYRHKIGFEGGQMPIQRRLPRIQESHQSGIQGREPLHPSDSEREEEHYRD